MVRRREGGTHDDFQEDVITTACWPLHSLYGVWGEGGDVGVVECLLLLLFSFHLLCALALGGLTMSHHSLPGLPQSGRSKMEGREEGRFGGELGAWIGKSPKG